MLSVVVMMMMMMFIQHQDNTRLEIQMKWKVDEMGNEQKSLKHTQIQNSIVYFEYIANRYALISIYSNSNQTSLSNIFGQHLTIQAKVTKKNMEQTLRRWMLRRWVVREWSLYLSHARIDTFHKWDWEWMEWSEQFAININLKVLNKYKMKNMNKFKLKLKSLHKIGVNG